MAAASPVNVGNPVLVKNDEFVRSAREAWRNGGQV
jgi:hypothetical protein